MPTRSPVFVTLAENIRLARTYRRWTQEQLAEACGIHRSYVTSVEAGTRNIGIETLERLAAGVGVSSYVLLMPVSEAQSQLFAASRMVDYKNPSTRGK